MSNRLPEPSSQRASDADREAVIEVLRTAASDGRLDLAEFEERMAATYQAKTFGELAPLTVDLGSTEPARAAGAASSEVVVRSIGSSTKRNGRWVVPRRIVVEGKFGSTRLDLTEAQLQSRDVEIALDSTAGSVTIIVPDDTTVDTGELVTSFGQARVRVSSSSPDPQLRLRVTGQAHMGSVVVRRRGFFQRWFGRRR